MLVNKRKEELHGSSQRENPILCSCEPKEEKCLDENISYLELKIKKRIAEKQRTLGLLGLLDPQPQTHHAQPAGARSTNHRHRCVWKRTSKSSWNNQKIRRQMVSVGQYKRQTGKGWIVPPCALSSSLINTHPSPRCPGKNTVERLSLLTFYTVSRGILIFNKKSLIMF